jgi:acetolactate synthase-1/2/3 large subunit
MPVTGSELVAKALTRQGIETMFFLMGGPMLFVESACIKAGIRSIDVRHEQAAAMMAHAYARVLNRPGVCIACSGPGTLNLGTGLANALIDCAPVVALGGSSPVSQYGLGAFQEIDQVAAMRPLVKWAERVYDVKRIPEMIDVAFRQALSGKPGPVYLDIPGDVLYEKIEESEIVWPARANGAARPRPPGDPGLVEKAIKLLANAERPIVVSGSGVLWSDAAADLKTWIDATGIPFYTTPQGRGVIPEDHAYSYLNARSLAFKEADVAMVVSTRLNYVLGFGQPPRFSPAVKFVRIDIDPAEIAGGPRVDVGIVGDASAVLRQLIAAVDGRLSPKHFARWRERLHAVNLEKQAEQEKALATDQVPIHPLRLCKEVRDFMNRDAILVVDGQEILNYSRQSIPTHVPGHRLNSGPFGTMGVGLPFGIGAKVAKPEKQVIVLHGDGSFGMNGLELDTAARHRIPVLVVVSLNGGWTADPDRSKPGRDLGYTRFDEIARALGCHGEYVEKPSDIRPALARAARVTKEGRPALVNVVTDWRARASTAKFSTYAT